MLSPHFPLHNTGGVTAVANGDCGLVIDQVWYLLSIVLVGWSEEQCSQSTLRVAGCMELKAVVPALPVLAKGSNAFGYSVPVGSDEFADLEHGGIHEAEWRIPLQGLLEQPHERWKRFVAMLDKFGVGWQMEVVLVVCLYPAPDILEESLWCSEAAEQQDGDCFTGGKLGVPSTFWAR